MPKIVWNDSFSVGVPELDAHHRHLADLINQLAEYRRKPDAAAAVDEILAALIDYASYHFKAEEDLLAACGFPHLEAHQGEHRQFCDAVTELRFGASRGIVVIDRLFVFLARWWRHHILREDRQYQPYLSALRNRPKPFPEAV